jgi:hypothetical protein
MEITKEDLAGTYKRLNDYELIELYKSDSLSDFALSVLNSELIDRGLTNKEIERKVYEKLQHSDKSTEKKEFAISEFAITLAFAIRLFPALMFFMLSLLFYFYYSTTDLFFFSFSSFLLLWALYFLKRPYKIVIDVNEIIFRSYILKPIIIDIKKLISVKELRTGWYTRFDFKENSIITLSNIRNKDKLFRYIHSINSNIEIKHRSKYLKYSGTLLRIIFLPIVYILLLLYIGLQ